MAVEVNPNGVLAGQVAVVTGASRGIGEAVAVRYAMEGASVVVTARTLDPGNHVLEGSINETAAKINAMGGRAIALRADLAVPEHREALIAQVEEAFGPVDILVNNAAVTYFAPVAEFTEKRYNLMMDVQVWSPFRLAQLVIPGMIERGGGRILNVSSHAAIHPQADVPGRGGTVYGMCKAALERFTTGLAQELYPHNVGVNVISPGLIATPGAVYHNLITEESKDRVVPVEHMAEACLRLVYGNAQEITGRIDYADQVMEEFQLKAAPLD